MSLPRKILIAAGALAVLAIIALAALPFLVNVNRLRPLVQAQLENRLHRQVSLGPMELKTFPLSVRVSGFIIGQPAGFPSAKPFLEANEVYVGVALWPLLHKQINIDAIRLQSPRFEIIRNPKGAWNYDNAGEGPAAPGAPSSITLDELRVEDGQVAIEDQSTSTRDVYKHIDLTLKGLGPNRRGSIAGSVRLETMAAVLNIRSDFENRDVFHAKGTLDLKSDRSQDALDVDFDVSRAQAPSPLAINSLTAKIGGLSASAAGTVDIERTPAELRLHVQMANAPIADLLRVAGLYGAKFPAGLKAEGMLAADVRITGSIDKPILAGKIDATKAQISAKDLAEPVRASELHIDFTPDSLTTRPFTLETGRTRLTAQATVNGYSGPSPQVAATLQTSAARLEELLRIAAAYGMKPSGLAGSGDVTLNLKLSQTGKVMNYSGSGAIRNVSLTAPQLPKALTVSTAAVTFAEDRVGFDHLQAALGAMHVAGAGSVRDFSRPNVQFDLHVDQLNTAELAQWGGSSGKQPAGKPPARTLDKLTANGVIAVDKLIYDRIALSNVKATVNFANSILKLDPIAAFVFGGEQTGSVTADLRAANPAYAIKARLTNVDANQLLSATTSAKQLLSGALAGNVDVQFVDRPNEDIAKSLNGKIQFQMGQGRLSGVQILNQIASIGQFLGYSKKPEPFTNIVALKGSLNIQNGLAATNDLFMDLGGATLSGAGTLGLVDQSLRLHVTTVLGKAFAQQNIPGQIGGLLTTALANQNGELIVPAIVTGTFSQPKFAPDLEQIAQLKLRGLLPTADNPAAFTSGMKGIVEAITGKKSAAKPAESKPGESKPAELKPGSILDLFKQFGKEKNKDKPAQR